MKRFVYKLPLSVKSRELLLKAARLEWQHQQTSDPVKSQGLGNKLSAIGAQLNTDPCYIKLREALFKKYPEIQKEVPEELAAAPV